MWGIVASAVGRLATLTTRLSQTWADDQADAASTIAANLNQTVASRASDAALATVDNNVDTILSRVNVVLGTRLDTAINSLQTGYVSTTMNQGVAEYELYHNVTVSSVDVNKAYCFFQGGCRVTHTSGVIQTSSGISMIKWGTSDTASTSVTAAMNGSTSLRLGTRNPYTGFTSAGITGRWYIIEFK